MSSVPSTARRALVAVVGDGGVLPGHPVYEVARQLGRALVDEGHRVLTGGRGGVMEAASRGARESTAWAAGDVVALLPGLDPREANPWVDIAVPTGLSHLRNGLIASADAVVGVGGAAGTLSELALAWVFNRLIVAVRGDGWAGRLADTRIDGRLRFARLPEDRVHGADGPEEAARLVSRLLPAYGAERGSRER